MKDLIAQLQIRVEENLYVKDPSSSDLGQNILENGLKLINETGLESFTFGKLAKALNTTESSIYRYFENKHKLLLYLTSIYWGWLEYTLVFSTANIENPEQKLKTGIISLCKLASDDELIHGLSLKGLQNLAILESSKIYITKEAKQEDEKGLFNGYERLCERLSKLISNANNKYAFPSSLASTAVETIHHQLFFAQYLPSLTNVNSKKGHELDEFITQMVFSSIKKKA